MAPRLFGTARDTQGTHSCLAGRRELVSRRRDEHAEGEGEVSSEGEGEASSEGEGEATDENDDETDGGGCNGAHASAPLWVMLPAALRLRRRQ